MTASSAIRCIRLRGVRHHNLKNFDLDLPCNRLIVITGLSGSGKSSLAFDTLFAEGQRRYIETFSPYARQFFDRMDKPQVDRIDGIPPAIALGQKNSVKTTRSTVGTMTEICDHMKLLWPHVARLFCRQCGNPVAREAPQAIWDRLAASQSRGGVSTRPRRTPPQRSEAPSTPARDVLVTFDLPLSHKLSLDESLSLIQRQGYQRALRFAAAALPRQRRRRRLVPGDSGLPGVPAGAGPSALTVFGEVLRLDEVKKRLAAISPTSLTIVQDRLRLAPSQRARFVEACEQAYHFGKGKLTVYVLDPASEAGPLLALVPLRFSNHFHCATCDLDYREPVPALFSFNHPLGACPACRGFGRIISIDYQLAVPDPTRTLAQGVVRPWQTGQGRECQQDLLRLCRKRGVPVDVPFHRLPRKWRNWVIEGDPDYGADSDHEWPRAWYGVKGYFRWLESRTYKMHVRVLLSRYRAYTVCPECRGRRFQPEALGFRLPLDTTGSSLTLADFYQLPLRDALKVIDTLRAAHPVVAADPFSLLLHETGARLAYLVEIGLGYLTLDRPTRTLSGGETERVNLTTCLGSRLVNTLFVLDEPSVGLHARDTDRLVALLQRLRDAGNTVVVVEHEARVIRAADQVVDLGPGQGATGGRVVFQGTYSQLRRCPQSLTGQYLSGRRTIPLPARRPVLPLKDALTKPNPPRLRLRHASKHNLRDFSVSIPLQRFVCISGVSGSGKSTLARDILLPFLQQRLQALESAPPDAAGQQYADGGRKPTDETTSEVDDDEFDLPETDARESGISSPATMLEGAAQLRRAVLIDQSSLGRTPRSNPALYTGAFDHLRELFAQTDLARRRGLKASAFSFNSPQGQCERCRGAGFEKIEMQFLSDVYIECPDCRGRRYRPHILEIELAPPPSKAPIPGRPLARRSSGPSHRRVAGASPLPRWNIADLLDATVADALEFLSGFPQSRPVTRASSALELLRDVGLGYLRLGQPINTLSGGESQRLKLVRHLADSVTASEGSTSPTLLLLDEPTTGLHFDDIRILLEVFQRLVDAGHSVIVIEHNLDVLKHADWIIDLGPEAGDQGGRLVAEGTPETIAAHSASHTGRALREIGV